MPQVRARQVREDTGALCVAWEGAGAARAAAFAGIGFAEVRAITDAADGRAATDFRANLDLAMPNIATLLVRSRQIRSAGQERKGPVDFGAPTE